MLTAALLSTLCWCWTAPALPVDWIRMYWGPKAAPFQGCGAQDLPLATTVEQCSGLSPTQACTLFDPPDPAAGETTFLLIVAVKDGVESDTDHGPIVPCDAR